MASFWNSVDPERDGTPALSQEGSKSKRCGIQGAEVEKGSRILCRNAVGLEIAGGTNVMTRSFFSA